MTQSFRLPDLGEGLTEAELVTWLVEVGDTVELNQVIAEVETAKASVELPSPYAGTVTALRAEAGTTVEVGTPIIDISDGDGSGPVAEEPAQEEERVPVLAGAGTGRCPSRSTPVSRVRNHWPPRRCGISHGRKVSIWPMCRPRGPAAR